MYHISEVLWLCSNWFICLLLCYYNMVIQPNQFINDVDMLSAATSLTHLLDTTDTDNFNNEINIIKLSAYYGETDFSRFLTENAGFSILSVNIQCINTKFDEFRAFVDRVNMNNPISVICLQECWLDGKDDVCMFNIPGYHLVHQSQQCCAHGGLITYVHNQFKCTSPPNINQHSSGWEYLCVEISHYKPHSKKICYM